MKRSELHAAVWTRPISALALEWEMSDTWLRKMCHDNGVPIPPRGYWQKVHAGHRLPDQPKPEGEDSEVKFKRLPNTTSNGASADPASAPSRAAAPLCAAWKGPKSSASSIDLVPEMALLERDADKYVRHRAMQELLAGLTAKLAVMPELDPEGWRDWLIGMWTEIQQRSPPCDFEAWAMKRFRGDKRSSR